MPSKHDHKMFGNKPDILLFLILYKLIQGLCRIREKELVDVGDTMSKEKLSRLRTYSSKDVLDVCRLFLTEGMLGQVKEDIDTVFKCLAANRKKKLQDMPFYFDPKFPGGRFQHHRIISRVVRIKMWVKDGKTTFQVCGRFKLNELVRLFEYIRNELTLPSILIRISMMIISIPTPVDFKPSNKEVVRQPGVVYQVCGRDGEYHVQVTLSSPDQSIVTKDFVADVIKRINKYLTIRDRKREKDRSQVIRVVNVIL